MSDSDSGETRMLLQKTHTRYADFQPRTHRDCRSFELFKVMIKSANLTLKAHNRPTGARAHRRRQLVNMRENRRTFDSTKF